MNPSEGKVVEYAKRFQWVDSSTVRIVNKEGVEKIVDIRNGFEEIAFGTVPLFEEIKESKHFYLDRLSPEIGDTAERLKHCYYRYKSTY